MYPKHKKLVLKNGIVNTELFTLPSRKINLTLIRKKLTEKHEQFEKCFGKDYLNTPTENIIEYLKSINEFGKTDSNDTLRQKFIKFSTTRHLQLWHDASCLSNHGFILFTVNALYDPAVYYSDIEYEKIAGKKSTFKVKLKNHSYTRLEDVDQMMNKWHM